MRNTTLGRSVLFAVAIGCLTLTPVVGQGQGRRNQGQSQPLYDPATEVTVKGSILEIKYPPSGRRGVGVHVTLKTDVSTLDVHLGPASFLVANQVTLKNGDQVEVTGSKVKYQGADALIARELKIGGKTLTLRDERGIPKWSPGRHGPSY